jgi:hypothetical protein
VANDARNDAAGPSVALSPDRLSRIEPRWRCSAAYNPPDLLDGGDASRATPVRIDLGKIGEWHDGCDRLARPLDDDPLACCSLVNDFPEPAPDVQRGHCSHGAMIAL